MTRRIPVVVLVLVLLVSGVALAQTPTASKESASDYIVSAPSRTIRLARADWTAMTNDYEWAENFEEIRKGPREEFERVVTVFKLPMTEDRRIGEMISPNEYVEMFVVHTGMLTVRVRLDKGSYWVMSRQTFTAPSVPGVDTARLQHDLSALEFARAREAFQSELDTTRYLLQSTF
jgi:hypothetical protein